MKKVFSVGILSFALMTTAFAGSNDGKAAKKETTAACCKKEHSGACCKKDADGKMPACCKEKAAEKKDEKAAPKK